MDLFGNHQARKRRRRRGLSNISPDLSVFLFMLEIVEFQGIFAVAKLSVSATLPPAWYCKSNFSDGNLWLAGGQIRSSSRYVRGERTYLCLQLNIKHLLSLPVCSYKCLIKHSPTNLQMLTLFEGTEISKYWKLLRMISVSLYCPYM